MTKIMKGGVAYNATANMVALTQAEYDTLTTAQKNNGNFYFIIDSDPSYFSAENIDYDNTDSGLTATNIQDAVDELSSDKADRVVALPPEYDATSTYSKGDLVTYNNNIYQSNIAISQAEAWDSAHWDLVTPDTDYLHSINPNGNGSFSFNRKGNTTIGTCSFAEGYNTTASGRYSHAEGNDTTASNTDSHAEGYNTTASGACAHTEGSSTTATNGSAHAEGYSTSATGSNSHAEGQQTVASGYSAHAEGYFTRASGDYSHAEGRSTTANHKSQRTFGEYNVLDDSTATASNRGNYVEIVGNGTSSDARSNARTLDWSGNEVLAGTLTAQGVNVNNVIGLDGSSGSITCTSINGVDPISIVNKGTAINLNVINWSEYAYLFNYLSSAIGSPHSSAGGYCIWFVNKDNRHYGSQIAFTNAGLYFRALRNDTYDTWVNITNRQDVKSQVTFNETVTGTNTQFWLKNGNLIIYYQGESKTHNANDTLFTLPASLKPSNTIYCTMNVNENAFGDIEISSTGVAKINQISVANASGRVYFHCVIPLI